jgi:hypothetical protein
MQPMSMLPSAAQFWTQMAQQAMQLWLGSMASYATWGQMPLGSAGTSSFDLGAPQPVGSFGASRKPAQVPVPVPSLVTPAASVASAAPAERLAVAVDVASVRRTEVVLDLPERSATRGLTVQELRAVDDPSKPPLPAVVLEVLEGRLRVRLSVPSEHPAGVYVGAILDGKTYEVRGTLRVVVHPESP